MSITAVSSLARRRAMKMVRPIVGVLAAATALGVASCSGSGPTRPVFDPTALPEGDGTARELRERWDQWRRLGPRSYGYEFYRGCFCTAEYVTPAWVEVRDGRVVSARALETRRPLRVELFAPIDSLFARAIREAEAGGRVLVRYDPRLGYPAWLTIGMPEADAGVVFTVPSLVAR